MKSAATEQAFAGSQQQAYSQPFAPQMGEAQQQAAGGMYSQAQALPSSQVQQPMAQTQAQPQSAVETVASEADKKKQKGGFFKKFMGKSSHEQH